MSISTFIASNAIETGSISLRSCLLEKLWCGASSAHLSALGFELVNANAASIQAGHQGGDAAGVYRYVDNFPADGPCFWQNMHAVEEINRRHD
jgi:hypothetical protein